MEHWILIFLLGKAKLSLRLNERIQGNKKIPTPKGAQLINLTRASSKAK